jgi:hypothetical protein
MLEPLSVMQEQEFTFASFCRPDIFCHRQIATPY